MPIFSFTPAAPFPEDNRYFPSTEVAVEDTPPYAFYFHPPGDFSAKFNFDDAREFKYANTSVKFDEIDLGSQYLYYHRLFRTRNGRSLPRYYLCPWVIIPYRLETSGPHAGHYNATIGDVHLNVRPYPAQMSGVTQKVRDRIVQANIPTSRTLRLWSSDPGVRAVWDSRALTAVPSEIDEADCIVEQPITVTIDSTPIRFDYSARIELHASVGSGPSTVMGAFNLLYCEVLEKKAFFIEVTEVLGSTNTLRVKMLDGSPASAMLADLNHVMAMSGIHYSDPGVTLALTDGGVLVPGTDILLSLGEEVVNTSKEQVSRVTDKFTALIASADATPWSAAQSEYLIVCHMPYATLTETIYAGDQTITKTTHGDSNMSSRMARVYLYNRKTMAHECAHALGLPHWFHTTSDAISTIKTNVTVIAEAVFDIHSDKDLFEFHDDVNISGLRITALARLSQHSFSDLKISQVIRSLLFARIYTIYKTDNLMDYRPAGSPIDQEQLRKHQIEQIRYFA